MNVSANNNTFPSAAPDTATNQTAAPGAAINQSILTLTGQHSKHKQYSQHINFNIFSRTFSRLALSILLALAATNAAAQSASNYTTTYNGTILTDVSVQHRAPMWYNYNAYGGGGVDGGMVTVGSTGQQVAHEYEETIYMHKGQTVQLNLPCASVADDGTYSDWDYKDYYRWYNYNTDGVFSHNSTGTRSSAFTSFGSSSDKSAWNYWNLGSGFHSYDYNYDGYLSNATNVMLHQDANGTGTITETSAGDYTVAFSACVSQGLTIQVYVCIDGNYDCNYNINYSDCHPSGVETAVTGTLSFSATAGQSVTIGVRFNGTGEYNSGYVNFLTITYAQDGESISTDLLKGGDYEMWGTKYSDGGRYKFANGYVGGMATPGATPFGIAYFTYRDDDSNFEYYIACDYSNYDEFTTSPYTPRARSAGEHCVYFVNYAGWSNVDAWVWDDNTNYTGDNWPGASCTKVNDSPEVWKWTYTGTATTYTPTYVIFNDGNSNDTQQTGSLPYVDGKVYYIFDPSASPPVEPTLIGRSIFHIIDVDEVTDSYTTAITASATGGDYVENYNITFPTRHTAYSPETVGIAMDARAYAIPNIDNDGMDSKKLDVSYANLTVPTGSSSPNFQLYTTSLQNCQRAISFGVGADSHNGQWEVPDGTEVDIYVTEGDYKVAHFHLTFKEESVPLTDKQVSVLDYVYGEKNQTNDDIAEKKIEKYITGAWWEDLSTRSPEYLANNFDLMASLNFKDYFTESSADVFDLPDDVTPHFAAFPMTWDYTGYGFNNGTMGARSGNFHDAIIDADHEHVNAGQYAIMDAYYGWDDISGDVTTYAAHPEAFMYIDGTQTPGNICTLPLKGTFCTGTTLHVIAWMKGANTYNSSTNNKDFYVRDDSSIIMTILGNFTDNDGNTIQTEVASFSSGQIRLMNDQGGNYSSTNYGPYVKPYNDDGGNDDDWGKGSENQWWQVAFSFTVTDNDSNNGEVSYDSYSLQLKNYSASSNGADFYFANLEVYVSHPEYTVEQIYQTSGSEMGLYRADFNYETLFLVEGDGEEHKSLDYDGAEIEFAVINENKYRESLLSSALQTYDVESWLAEHTEDYEYTEAENAVKAAINASLVTVYDNQDGTGSYSKQYNHAAFYYYWAGNDAYNNNSSNIYSGANIIGTSTKKLILSGEKSDSENDVPAVWLKYRRDAVNATKMLSIDFYAEIDPYVPYRIIAEAKSEDDDDDLKAYFADVLMGNTCAISSEFFFSSTTELRMNGECFDPTYTYCEGQVNNFSIHQTYRTYDKDETMKIYYTDDKGTDREETYTAYVIDNRNEQLNHSYCDWFYGSEDTFLASSDGGGPSVKEALYSFRTYNSRKYINDTDLAQAKKDGLDKDINTEKWYAVLDKGIKAGTIVLFKESVNAYAESTRTQIVIQPVIYDVEAKADLGFEYSKEPYSDPDEYKQLFSFAYIALELWTDTAKDDEGNDITTPELRAGFCDQTYPTPFTNLIPAVRAGVSQLMGGSIQVNTRDGKLTDGGNLRILNDDDYSEFLYLVATDDPAYHDILDTDEFTTLTHPVGEVTITGNGNGTTYIDRQNNYITITFNDDDVRYCTCIPTSCSCLTGEEDNKTCPCTLDNCSCEGCSCGEIGAYAFVPHEGYTYDFSIFLGSGSREYTWIDRVNETEDEKETDELSCPGLMQLEVKVVPEYLVWQGDMRDNWNRDGAWRRAATNDLNGRDVEPTDPLNPMKNGFVPMLFSKAVIKNDWSTDREEYEKQSRAEIYNAGFENSSGVYTWHGNFDDNDTYTYGTAGKIIIDPSLNIMYDMPVYEGATHTFRVNLCDQLHLESDAQLLHSELLMCDTVWTDIKIPSGEWHLVSVPLKATYAGDWYSGSEGKEETPYFIGLNFEDGSYNRFAPLVYQRSWSKHDSQIVFSNSSDNITALPAYATTGWTSVYNDVTTSYQPGEGFAIKSFFSFVTVNNNDSITFRFPKDDTKYGYYAQGASDSSFDSGAVSKTTDRGATNSEGELLIADLINRRVSGASTGKASADNDYDDAKVYKTTGLPTVNIASDNGIYIIGNPFTSPMSLSKFLSANSESLGTSPKCWYSSAQLKDDQSGGSEVITVDGETASDGESTSTKYIPPYGAFFVQPGTSAGAKGTRADSDSSGDSGSGSGLEISFTKAMQDWDPASLTESGSTGSGTGNSGDDSEQDEGDEGDGDDNETDSKLIAFSIRAKSGQGASSAAFAYFDDATDEYDASEDAVLLSDITWHSDSIPMVYTVAGDMAASVNRLHSLNVVPIGVFVADSCAYTLTFVGTYNLASPVLYDALNDTETEITEGMTLSLKGASHGRYFIKTTGIEEHGIEEAASEYSITAYSPADRTIVVSSNAEIESVEIYSIGGTLEKKVSGNGSIACTVDGVDSGIAVVRARTSEGTFTRKIIVR